MIVIKFGGHAMSDQNGTFAKAISRAISQGVFPVIVHGGGPQIDQALIEAGIDSELIGGFRYTTLEIMDVVERVLSDEVGPKVAASLQTSGVNAFAICGRKSGTLFAKPLKTLVDGTSIDLGRAGEISKVDTKVILSMLSDSQVPVISPVAGDKTSTMAFNVNGDIAAAAIAGALDADSLIIMTDVEGIYRSWPDKSSLISTITQAELSALKSTFEKGMAPKVKACLDAITAGAKAVRIIDGTNPDALSHALAGHGGTLVTQ
jgi:acetylglutamate kinase